MVLRHNVFRKVNINFANFLDYFLKKIMEADAILKIVIRKKERKSFRNSLKSWQRIECGLLKSMLLKKNLLLKIKGLRTLVSKKYGIYILPY